MAGGHATHAGIKFQNEVAAWVAVHVLAARPITAILEDTDAVPVSLQLEATSPVDDIVVQTSKGGYFFLNVKTTISASKDPKSELAKVFGQFVRQWLMGVPDSSQETGFRKFDTERDRLVLVLRSDRGQEFASSLSTVVQRIRDQPSNVLKGEFATTQPQLELLDVCRELTSYHWKRQLGSKIEENELVKFLSGLQVVRVGIEGATKEALHLLLTQYVTGDGATAPHALDALSLMSAEFSVRRSGGDARILREQLKRRNISIIGEPQFSRDITKLKLLSGQTSQALEHYGYLEINIDGEEKSRISLARSCTSALASAAKHQSLLLIGDPGSGKSGALYGAAQELIKQGYPVLTLAVDQLSASSLAELQDEMGLEHPLVDVLSSWQSEKSPVLFIDALDASRGGASERAISQLIRGVIERATQWRIVASIRKFDLQYGATYQKLFEGQPVNIAFADSNFEHIAHLNVPELTDDEISEIAKQWPRLNTVIEKSDDKRFKRLLGSPFNLSLLATILTRSKSDGFNLGNTQLDLLKQYWLYRVNDPTPADGLRNSRVLLSLIDEMLSQRRLFAHSESVPPALIDNLAELQRRGVLVQQPNSNRIFFGHHMLFDFAMAKLKLLSDNASSVLNGLTGPDDAMLLLAPAAMLALNVLWETDNDHETFWKLSFDLASNTKAGSFSKSLPARVVAEATTNSQDVERLIEGLSSNVEESRKASVLLIRHIFGVLLAKVVKGVPTIGSEQDPWCHIARTICEKAMIDVIWPMKAVIAQWTATEENPTSQQLFDLAACARLMLHASYTSKYYDDGAISSGISGLIRGFHCDPDAADQTLRVLLEPNRVNRYGHTELFQFARGFRRVAECRPQLAADFLCTVYTTPLPSADEKTSLGQSRILSLSSNKKQDFEGIRYLLQKQLRWFMVKFPGQALPAIRHILIRSNEDDSLRPNCNPVEVSIGESSFHMLEDHSCVWWNESAHHHNVRAAILDELELALIEVAEDGNRNDFRDYANNLLQGDVWAGSVAAFLKALTKGKTTDTQLGVEFLSSQPILSSLDTSFLSGELIKKLYTKLPEESRSRIELAIFGIECETTREVLIGCLDDTKITNRPVLALRRTIEQSKKLRENIPPFSLESTWGESDKNWWLKHEGVDVDSPDSKLVLDAIVLLDATKLPDDRTDALNILTSGWHNVQRLAQILIANTGIHNQLQSQGWDAVAEACRQSTEKCTSATDLAQFSNLRELIDYCLKPTLSPVPVFDKKTEDQFESSPSWGRPAPRIPATESLMSFIRAAGVSTKDDSEQVLKLARDPAVAVRHSVLARANVVCHAAPELSMKLASIAFDEEKNNGVLMFFLGSFNNYLSTNIEWSSKKLLELDRRIPEKEGESRDHLISHVVGSILRLWITWDIKEAGERLQEWADASLDNVNRIGSLLHNMRQLVVFGNPKQSNSKDDAVREKGQILFDHIVANLALQHERLYAQAIERNEPIPKLTECTRLLDVAAHELYFGSGAYDMSKSENAERVESADVRRRFLASYLPTLSRLARIPYPSVTHPVLETIEALIQDGPEQTLELLLEAIETGGKGGGYASESMGADLVVKLVRRFIADYPSLIANNSRFREGIVDALNLFADVGWPEARRLVYALPEMLR